MIYQACREARQLAAPFNEIQKTVFVKAPRNLPYGEVVKLVDAVKIAGAEAISLQIDDLQ